MWRWGRGRIATATTKKERHEADIRSEEDIGGRCSKDTAGREQVDASFFSKEDGLGLKYAVGSTFTD